MIMNIRVTINLMFLWLTIDKKNRLLFNILLEYFYHRENTMCIF